MSGPSNRVDGLDRAEIIRLYRSGMTMEGVGDAHGVGPKVVGRILREEGVKPRGPAAGERRKLRRWDRRLDAQLIQEYESGRSALSLAGKYDTGTHSILYQLRRLGVPIRNQQQRSALGPTERKRRTTDETAIADQLRALGFTVEQQTGVDSYNVDVTCERFAVELWTGKWHLSDEDDHVGRTNCLLGHGWTVIVVWSTRKHPLRQCLGEHLSAYFDLLRPRGPEYCVVGGGGELHAIGRAHLDAWPRVTLGKGCDSGSLRDLAS